MRLKIGKRVLDGDQNDFISSSFLPSLFSFFFVPTREHKIQRIPCPVFLSGRILYTIGYERNVNAYERVYQ